MIYSNKCYYKQAVVRMGWIILHCTLRVIVAEIYQIIVYNNILMQHALNEIKENMIKFTENDSGCMLEEIKILELKIETYNPLFPPAYYFYLKKLRNPKRTKY